MMAISLAHHVLIIDKSCPNLIQGTFTSSIENKIQNKRKEYGRGEGDILGGVGSTAVL